MNRQYEPRLSAFTNRGVSWPQRALLTLLGAGVIVIGFFFLTLALAAGAILAAVIGVRVWWIMRRLRAARNASVPLEGQYSVVEQSRLEEHDPRR
jgi:predicted lipid-binding transport protein (Tim44 family)